MAGLLLGDHDAAATWTPAYGYSYGKGRTNADASPETLFLIRIHHIHAGSAPKSLSLAWTSAYSLDTFKSARIWPVTSIL
jgi:hypothetical protein